MSNLIQILELNLAFDEKVILNEVTFGIQTGQVVGLVGKNGAGKTSLLRVISEELEPDSGDITKLKGLRIGYLPQEFELSSEKTVYENILEAEHFVGLEIDWKVEEEINDLLKELRCPDKNDLIKNLSGGQKRRVALAKALINKPDLLILDEPTNHLDLETIEHLEKLIKSFDGAILLVSHDRYFLDRVTTQIFELYEAKVYSHKGNYSKYLKSKEIRLGIEESADDKRKQVLKKEREWVYAGVKARETKNKGRLRRYDEMMEIEDFRREKEPDIVIPKPFELGNKIVNLDNVTIKTPNGQVVVKDFNLEFLEGMKIGLLGPNGVGKSTLLRALIGEGGASIGEINIGENTIFNYLDQEKAQLDPNKTIFKEVSNEKEKVQFGERMINSRAYLKRFLFDPEMIKRHISELSGGERTRVVLAKILKRGGNFLVLDEPTNDLDLDILAVLETSVQQFNGCAVIVSHDRYFLNQVCNYILFLRGDGEFILSTGDYDSFVRKFGGIEIASYAEDVNKEKQEDKKWKKALAKKEREQKKKVGQLERKMETMQEKIVDLQNKFADPDFYNRNRDKLVELHAKLEKWKEDLAKLEAEWLSMVE